MSKRRKHRPSTDRSMSDLAQFAAEVGAGSDFIEVARRFCEGFFRTAPLLSLLQAGLAPWSALPTNVRFTPKSGHRSARRQCPLCAKSRHFDLPVVPVVLPRSLRTGFSRVLTG